MYKTKDPILKQLKKETNPQEIIRKCFSHLSSEKMAESIYTESSYEERKILITKLVWAGNSDTHSQFSSFISKLPQLLPHLSLQEVLFFQIENAKLIKSHSHTSVRVLYKSIKFILRNTNLPYRKDFIFENSFSHLFTFLFNELQITESESGALIIAFQSDKGKGLWKELPLFKLVKLLLDFTRTKLYMTLGSFIEMLPEEWDSNKKINHILESFEKENNNNNSNNITQITSPKRAGEDGDKDKYSVCVEGLRETNKCMKVTLQFIVKLCTNNLFLKDRKSATMSLKVNKYKRLKREADFISNEIQKLARKFILPRKGIKEEIMKLFFGIDGSLFSANENEKSCFLRKFFYFWIFFYFNCRIVFPFSRFEVILKNDIFCFNISNEDSDIGNKDFLFYERFLKKGEDTLSSFLKCSFSNEILLEDKKLIFETLLSASTKLAERKVLNVGSLRKVFPFLDENLEEVLSLNNTAIVENVINMLTVKLSDLIRDIEKEESLEKYNLEELNTFLKISYSKLFQTSEFIDSRLINGSLEFLILFFQNLDVISKKMSIFEIKINKFPYFLLSKINFFLIEYLETEDTIQNVLEFSKLIFKNISFFEKGYSIDLLQTFREFLTVLNCHMMTEVRVGWFKKYLDVLNSFYSSIKIKEKHFRTFYESYIKLLGKHAEINSLVLKSLMERVNLLTLKKDRVEKMREELRYRIIIWFSYLLKNELDQTKEDPENDLIILEESKRKLRDIYEKNVKQLLEENEDSEYFNFLLD